jgi:hypothetical protein
MLMARLISEFANYHETTDYVHGVLVEVTGTVIEVVLLVITIPGIVYFVQKIRSRPIRATADFYLFQIFHKITRVFLSMAGIDDITPILAEEQNRNPQFERYSHFVYGNLENKLFALKKTFAKEDDFRTQIEHRTLSEFEEYRDTAERCLDEMDRLTAMLVGIPRVQQELFEMRILVYPLRDLCAQIAEDMRRSTDGKAIQKRGHAYDLERMAEQLTEEIEKIFTKRRKLIDSMVEHRRKRAIGHMFLTLPYVVIRRWMTIRLCRLKGTTYRDFISPSPIPDMLQEWRTFREITQEQAAEVWGIPLNDYCDYEQGYRHPPMMVWEEIKPELREMMEQQSNPRPSTS